MAGTSGQSEKAVRIRILGRVQGVSYRAWAHRRAAVLGVTGWVRNLPDGAVEVVVQGEPAAVDALVEQSRIGPPEARVDALEAEAIAVDPALSRFDVRS